MYVRARRRDARSEREEVREQADPQGPGEDGCFHGQLLAACAVRLCLRFAPNSLTRAAWPAMDPPKVSGAAKKKLENTFFTQMSKK